MMKSPKLNGFDWRTIVIAASIFISILGGAITVSFWIGYSKRDMEQRQQMVEKLEKQMDDIKHDAMNYTEQEVGGLRADWERDRVSQEKRFDKLEK